MKRNTSRYKKMQKGGTKKPSANMAGYMTTDMAPGNYKNLTPEQGKEVNRATGVTFGKDFLNSGYFVTEEQWNAQNPTQNNVQAPKTIVDMTGGHIGGSRKVWYNQRPEWYEAKREPIEGQDYKVIPAKQWADYQNSEEYINYKTPKMQSGGNMNYMSTTPPIKSTSQQVMNYTVPTTNGAVREEQRSRLKQIYKIQTGVENADKGSGYYLYYKDPNSTAFNEKTDKEFTTREAYNNQVVPSQQYREYLSKTGGLNRPVKQIGGYYENNNPYFMQSPGQQPSPNMMSYSMMSPDEAVPSVRNQVMGLDLPAPVMNTTSAVNIPNELQSTTAPSVNQFNSSYNSYNSSPTNNNENDNFQYFNPYGGFDIPSAAYKLGEGIRTGNTFDTVASGLKLGTGLARNFAAGMGQANRREFIMNDFADKVRQSSRQATQYMQEGGMAQQQPSPEAVIQAYAELSQQDPQAIIQQLQQLSPEEQSQALQEMMMVLEQQQAAPEMQNGGYMMGNETSSKKKDLGGFRDEKEMQKAMTGEYAVETIDNKEAVAELEVDEYIKKPDGQVLKVEGETHEKGGVLLTEDQLPDGSKIISDYLKVGKEGAKKFNNEYSLGVRPTDTYAKVLDRFNKKIGLTKIIEEQEIITKELNKQAEKLLERPENSETLTLNINFKTKKFEELEEQKRPLKELQQRLFEEVFQPQEESKGEEISENMMQNGGLYNGDMIINLSTKYNLPKERVAELLNEFRNGGVKKYQDGTKYSVSKGQNEYSGIDRRRQSPNQTAYGTVESQLALQRLYNNFPDIINSDAGFKNYIEVDSSGNIKFKSNVPLNTQSALVNNVQRLTDERMRDSAQTILSNPDNFDPEAVKEAQRYYDYETFIPGAQEQFKDDKSRSIRDYDSKLGDFTSGRYALEMNLVTPEEKKLLNSSGIKTLKQLKDSPLKSKLSAETLERVGRVEKLVGDSNSDYGINEVVPEAVIPQREGAPMMAYQAYNGNNGSSENTNLRLLNLPDQSPLLPDSLQGALKVERRYDRVEAPLASADAQINEIRRQEQSAMQSINNLPDAQRASAVAQLQANTQASINGVMSQVQNQNLNNTFQANATNANIQAREEDARASDLLDYEKRILRGEAITNQDIKNYFKTSQKVNLNNYNTVNATNLVNSMYDNSKFDGNSIQQTNLDYAGNYSNAKPPTEQEILDLAKQIEKQRRIGVKGRKRFGGTK